MAAPEYPFAEPPAPGTTAEVAPGVHWLRMALPFALDHINLWLVEDGDGYLIVDSGLGNAPTRAPLLRTSRRQRRHRLQPGHILQHVAYAC